MVLLIYPGSGIIMPVPMEIGEHIIHNHHQLNVISQYIKRNPLSWVLEDKSPKKVTAANFCMKK